MSVSKKQVAALYVAIYNRAPDAEGLQYWTEQDVDFKVLAQDFIGGHAAFEELYGELSNEDFVKAIYQNVLGQEGDAEGIEYWTNELDNGATQGDFLAAFLNGVFDYEGDDAAALERQDYLNNRVEVALYFAEKLGENSNGDVDSEAYKLSKEILEGVGADADSVAAAKKAIDAAQGEFEGQEFFLKVGQDILEGGAGNDTFTAYITQNDNGQQVNTLGSGDRIDGGAGNDTLFAEVAGNTHVSGGNQQIQPKTTSVENIKLEAQASDINDGWLDDTGIFGSNVATVNAKNMNGVNYIGSERSNADLLINDLTTKDNAGNARNTNEMTIGMKYSSTGNSNWDASNLTVLFDQDYLTREDTQLTKAFFWLEDRQGAKADPTKPIARIDSNGVRFNLDGVEKQIVISDEDFQAFMNGGAGAGTWEGYVALLEKALKLAQETDPSLKDLSWSLDTSKMQTHGLDGTLLPVPAPAMVLSSSSNQIVEAVGFHKDEKATGNYDVFGEVGSSANTEFDRVAINVELEKVGLTGDGGELVIGSNNKGSDSNTWNPDDVNNVGVGTVTGIEEFNITVNGGKDKSSSLAGLRSTNNQLKVVTVESEAGGDANLTIGNINTRFEESDIDYAANALKDVQTFDASKFKGDLDVTAALTEEVTEKYLADGGTDLDFAYTGGTGNDTFDILLSTANLASAGNASHGNFNFVVDGGDGNDNITVGLYNNWTLETGAGAWYNNQAKNANLDIVAGAGDDTVQIDGSGDWTVDLGTGNDVIYVNNDGDKAQWAFNVAAGDINTNTLEGKGEANYTFSNTTQTLDVTVEFAGFESTVKLVLNGNKTTQTAINEAIKEAIASDNVLSKLLEASSGHMAHTLLIDSLVDGAKVGDLTISVTDPVVGNTNAAELAKVKANIETPTDATAVVAEDGADVTHSTGVLDITGGAGDDVLVLSTSTTQKHELFYVGYDNGTDSIVNFTGGSIDRDNINLKDYSAKAYYTGNNVTDTTVKNLNAAALTDVTTPIADGQKFVVFSNDATDADSDGQITVDVWQYNATGDNVKLGSVGVLDFGDSTLFNAATDVIWA